MLYATSDIHGYPLDGFLRLLERAGFGDDDFLYVLGDVIDRNGDGGAAMLEWLTHRPNARLILGNHEDMLLACEYLFTGRAESASVWEKRMLSQWVYNGAEPTIRALAELGRRRPSALGDVLAYVRRAPLYDTVDTAAGSLLLVHSGLGGFDPNRSLDAYLPDEMLWHRPHPEERFFEDRITILGHTPTDHYGTPRRMFVTPTWIDIDVGGAMGRPPMLLRLDDLTPIYAES